MFVHGSQTCSFLQRMAMVNRRFSGLLSRPSRASNLWDTIVIPEQEKKGVDLAMQVVPWLVQRAAGERRSHERTLAAGVPPSCAGFEACACHRIESWTGLVICRHQPRGAADDGGAAGALGG